MADNVSLAVECLAMVAGLYPPKPLTRGDVAEAIGVPRAMERGVRAFMDSSTQGDPSRAEKIRYLSTWKRLNEPQDDSKLAAIIVDPAASAGLGAKLDQARAYLRDNWRPTQILTLSGPLLLAPASSEGYRCQTLYSMVNDPRRIVNRLSSGCVMSEETAAVKAIYPEFFTMISDLISAELFRRKMEKKSYRTPYRQELAIRMFAGMPAGSTVETINAEGAPPTPQLDIATKRERNDTLTKADRVDSGVPA